MATRTAWERVEAGGTKLLETLKRLVNQGNIHKVRIRQGDRIVAEFPLTIGVVGAVFAPILAAIGAITALMTDCAIEVQREVTEDETVSEADGETDAASAEVALEVAPLDVVVDGADPETAPPIG